MKNLKNIVATLTLTATLGLGATAANAGMLISDKATKDSKPCSAKSVRGVFATGILIIGKAGLLISDGLLLSDEPCKDGLLLSDGLLISD
jgi:hypothetical protein